MKNLFIMIILALNVSSLIAQDLYIKTKYNWSQAKPLFSEQWVGDGKTAQIAPTHTTIVDFDNKVGYLILPKKKFYIQAALPQEFAKLRPSEHSATGKTKVRVTLTGETKTIAGRLCAEYDIILDPNSLDPTHWLIYTTVDIPSELKKYAPALCDLHFRLQFTGFDDEALAELRKIEGFMMGSATIMKNMIFNSDEVVEITPKAAPPGTYAVPAGYKKRDKYKSSDETH
jgi:hypothetical protein